MYAERRQRLLDEVASMELDAVLVTQLVNVRYLTGFTGSNAALLVLPDTTVLATDGRYATQAGEQAPDIDVLVDRQLAAALVRRGDESRVRRLGFEAHHMTVAEHDAVSALVGDIAFVRMGEPVETLRAVKDDSELELLADACRITGEAFDRIVAELRPGRTERDVAHALEEHMRALGADGISFDTIVASGPNSAMPHHAPGDRALETGDFVKFDFGALLGGYHADMTRTVVLGAAAEWQREVYEIVAAAQRAGRAAVRPGASCRDVDAAARAVVDDSDFTGRFVHPLGHGVGLQIHERPTLTATAPDTLAERMPVTIEPGVYLPGRGGVRIEDTVVVRPDGPELLTTTTRELLEI